MKDNTHSWNFDWGRLCKFFLHMELSLEVMVKSKEAWVLNIKIFPKFFVFCLQQTRFNFAMESAVNFLMTSTFF